MNSSESKLSEGWSTLFLLAGMVMCVTWTIASARWVDDLQIINWIASVGLVVGVLLAKSRFRTLVAHLFSLVYGAAWISYMGTRLLPSPLTLRERLLELGYHINAWLWNVLNGGSSGDSLMFVLFLACVVWLLGYGAAWATCRTHRIWWVILPTATVLLINVYWGPPRLLVYLIAYVGFMLLFFIRFNLFLQQQAWSEARVRYDPEIVWDFLRYGAVFVVVVMALAWGAPGAAASKEVADFWGKFSEPWERIQDTWNRVFFSSRYYGQAQPNAFGTTMSLGGAVHLGNRLVMDVAAPVGHYWRAVVYDEYNGSGWVNNDSEMVYLEPYDSDFVVPQFEMRRIITQTYTFYLPGRTQLLAAAQPMAVNRAIKARNSRIIDRLPVERRYGELLDVSMIFARTPLESDESYVVVSAISAAGEDSLRTAGADYPAWVKERYLQLPDSLPQRVRDLAQELTRNETNPYDKALALEAYLRQIKYNELIESPPLYQDRVDWFLFDLQEGYCDYYSSAMVVMARAVGIPARAVAGYTWGEYVSEAGIYRVRDDNAHAWVEIYFPRYGWIEFEPTAAEPVIVRPKPASANTNNTQRERPTPDDELDRLRDMIDQRFDPVPLPEGTGRPWWISVLWVVGGLLVVGMTIGGSYWWLEEKGLAHVGLVRKVYARMTRFGRLLNIREQEPQTPFEYAATLSAEVPTGQQPIYRIAALFVEEQFSPRQADEEASVSAWHDLRPSLWRHWFGRWLERFQAPPEEDGSPSDDGS